MIRLCRMLFSLGTIVLLHASAMPQSVLSPQVSPTAHACDDLPHADHPNVRLDSGDLSAVIFLPDAKDGFYRGPRFDWSGLVGCVSLHGHTFFGEWFSRYDPMISDAVVGPAEEFRHPTSELGYDEALPGGLFLKIGVGILRRIDARPYRFGFSYPIVDTGRWTVKRTRRSITFRQELHSAIGYAYVYEKTLSLDKRTKSLILSHRLRNLGVKPLRTAVYNHDFFILDHEPTGAGMELRLPFAPIPDKPLPDSAQIDGKTIRFVAPIQPGHGVGAYVTGFSNRVEDFNFTFEDRTTGVGIQQTSDSPLARMYLWATPTTVCPEGYLAIDVAAGHSQNWKLNFRFFAPVRQK